MHAKTRTSRPVAEERSVFTLSMDNFDSPPPSYSARFQHGEAPHPSRLSLWTGNLAAHRVFLRAMRILIAALFLALCSPSGWSAETITRPAKNWQVYFSPRGGCTEAVVDALGKAKSTVLVQAYSFTSAPIARALVDAHRRGVQVQVVLDRSQRTAKYSSATFIYNYGIPCFIDAQHAIAHNKVIVIDALTVITGSFNFTKAAEDNNAENLLVIQDAQMASRYAQNWEIHRQHSEPYTGLPGHDQSESRGRKRQ
jgi:phosphatidylserine/phosphatidylglycerophosphate/cardiolipin synthase-like enzyme